MHVHALFLNIRTRSVFHDDSPAAASRRQYPDQMTDEKPLKSALEIAMERFRKNDEASGVEKRPISDAQKAAIAEARNFCEAKLAEQEVLHQSRMRKNVDPAVAQAMDQEYRRDRERLTAERDAKIEKIRAQS
jgi:hypothetical protein